MTSLTLLGLTLLVCLALLFFAPRIVGSFLGNRAAAKLLALPSDAPRARLDPESRFIIQMTETDVSCHRPDGLVETVRWDDLERIDILTNSDGPFAPDCFWLLIGPGTTGCCIPKVPREMLSSWPEYRSSPASIIRYSWKPWEITRKRSSPAGSGPHEHSQNYQPAQSSFTRFR